MRHKCVVGIALLVTVILLLVGIAVGAACSKKSGSAGDLTITSSVDSGHSHDVTIKAADIANPPATDKTIDTTYSGGHRHTITLTPANYQTIEGGNGVSVTSSSSGGHTHTFIIAK
ncbi:MAG: hypothetical protein FJ020_09140 [Chloroflexi bacterium]|nr:hypothetical protein [Chloroflexota bacterium]